MAKEGGDVTDDIIRRIDRAIYEVQVKGADAAMIEFGPHDYDLFRQAADPMLVACYPPPMPPSFRGIKFKQADASQVIGRFASGQRFNEAF
jgi:hypothetical protein